MFLSRSFPSSNKICRSVKTSRSRLRLTVPPPITAGRLHLRLVMSSSDAPTYASRLFRYTSGRWVYNERKRLQERERVFNCEQLQRLAAKAVSRDPSEVIGIEKIGEGAANRAFAILFRDGFKMVARVPYPSTEPKGLIVASEAATITFIRSKGVPTPEIFEYSCSPDNAAGTEYIFMEFCSGKDLGSVWDEMGTEDATRLIQNLVTLESQLSNIRLPASGSLYFLRDLPPDATKFAVDASDSGSPSSIYVGPCTDLHFWFGKRKDLQVNRGPFPEPVATMNAGALKETRYLEKHGRPLLPFDRFQRETFDFQEQDPAVHLDSLQKYLQISKHLIPPVAALTSPILRHPDLRPSNMFVSNNLEITALIDWQHSTALPAFLSAGVPDFLGPGPQPSDTAEITNGFEGDSDSERLHLLHQRHLYDTYLAMTERHNASHSQALAYPFSIGRQKIHRLSGDPWHGDNIPLRSSLIFVEQNWRQISADPEMPCPVSFAEEEVKEVLRLDDAEQQGVQQLEEFKSTIGLGPQGWVTNEDYDTAMEAIARMKKLSLEQAESDDELIAIRDHWVFDDMDEEEYA